MNTTTARAPAVQPVDGLVSTFESAKAYVDQVGRLPRKSILTQLARSERAPDDAESFLQMLEDASEHIHRQIEEIRRTLEPQSGKRPANRVKETMRKLVRSRELLEPAEFATALGWTRQALSKALTAHRVFFIEYEGTRYYPAFFADPRHERRHLEAVSKALGDLPGGSKWQFFTTGKGSLGGATPLDALLKGKLTQARASAAAFAEI